MAGERFVRACAFVLIALGIAALLVRAGDDTAPSAQRHAAGDTSSSTTLAADPGATTTTVAAPARKRSRAAVPSAIEANPCAGVTKHGPPPPDQSAFSEPPERQLTARRRVLATGSYGDYFWRLAIERSDTYARWDLEFDEALQDGSGGGGSGTDPAEPPLFVSGSSVGKDAWAYLGKASNDSACVVVTTKTSARVVTDEFYRDSAFKDGGFFVAFVSCLDSVHGAVVESFDAAGKRTGHKDVEPFPTKADWKDAPDSWPETPEGWCR